MLSLTEPAVTVAEADAYAGARDYAVWFGGTLDKDAALRRGQDYIAGRFNGRWKAAFANDEAPEAVKFAIVEAAVREAAAPGSLLPDWTGEAQVTREKVGPLETEYAAQSGAWASRPSFGIIDALLAGLIGSTAGGINFAVRRG